MLVYLFNRFYISILVKWLQHSIPNCPTYKVFFFIVLLFSVASFFGVVAVTVDRFLAIHLHLRYQETCKLTSAFLLGRSPYGFLVHSFLWHRCGFRLLLALYSLGISILLAVFFSTVVVYIKIYLARTTPTRIRSRQFLIKYYKQTKWTNFASIVKSAVGVFYVYLVFLFCYLPYFHHFGGHYNRRPKWCA